MLMSAPAMNVVPAPIRTMASALESWQARSTASLMRFGHAGAQGIHRRVVDGDDGNTVPYLVPNQR